MVPFGSIRACDRPQRLSVDLQDHGSIEDADELGKSKTRNPAGRKHVPATHALAIIVISYRVENLKMVVLWNV